MTNQSARKKWEIRYSEYGSYCLSDRWNSFTLSIWAPHQASFRGHPPISGSSKGFESPRKKCNIGTAKSHSGLDVFNIWLQSLSTALAAVLKKENKNPKYYNCPKIILYKNHMWYINITFLKTGDVLLTFQTHLPRRFTRKLKWSDFKRKSRSWYREKQNRQNFET